MPCVLATFSYTIHVATLYSQSMCYVQYMCYMYMCVVYPLSATWLVYPPTPTVYMQQCTRV